MLTHIKKNWVLLVVGIVVLVFIFIISQDDVDQLEANMETMTPVNNQAEDIDEDDPTVDLTVIVDVKGEVQNPGVYEMDKNSRIHDVINMAGGFSDDADEIPVNLAQKVYDELIIHVPKKGENTGGDGGQSESGTLRVNYATQEEIEMLPGIGPSKAAAILKYREEHGHFQTIDDLLEISGIGEKTLENMQADIQIP